MANYSEKADIYARIGYTVTASTRPTTTQLESMMNVATAYINSLLRASSNVTDTYGICKVYEIYLVWAMINNMFYQAEPELYTYMPVELTDDEIKILRLANSKFYPYSWELGE